MKMQRREPERSKSLSNAVLGVVVAIVIGASGSAAAFAATGRATATPPTNSAPPTISGTTREGHTLTASSGSWSGTTPIVFSYSWKRCDPAGAGCASIGGATNQIYVPTSADVGHAFRVSVTATNTAGAGEALSQPTVVIAAKQAPFNTSPPTISGTARASQKLTAGTGRWSGVQPIRFGYQWSRCDSRGDTCTSIGGATAQGYTLITADIGHTVRVKVTATNSDGTGTATSGPSAIVAAAGTAPAMTSPPRVTGKAEEGTRLSTGNGSWNGTTPLTFHYGWERCDATGSNCVTIAAPNSSRYTLTTADIGHTVRSAVTASNTAGASTAYSAATPLVASRAPTNTALPSVTGTAQAGQTLTASTGAWAGQGQMSFSYQWARCDNQGLNCAPIAGAQAVAYTVTAADVGHTLIVQVRAANAFGPGYANSKATGIVTAAARISLHASTTVVHYGGVTRLAGTVPAGQAGDKVTIVATPVGKTVATHTILATLTGGGAFSIVVQPKVQTTYQAQLAGGTSATQRVFVRPRVRLDLSSRNIVVIHVYETNPLNRHTALVQYWSARRHRWLTLRRRAVLHSTAGVPTIVSKASYSVRSLPTKTRLRVYLTAGQAGTGYLAGTSNTIRL